MGHFAEIKDGIVKRVIVAEQDFIDTQEGTWVQTSYNTHSGKHVLGGTPLRKNYANIGFVYDSTRDAFYEPQPYPSWSLNETTCQWEPPTPCPVQTYPEILSWEWNEGTTKWVEIT